MYYPFKILAIIASILQKLVLIIFIILILGIFTHKLSGSTNSVALEKFNSFDNQIIQVSRTYLPSQYNHQDISRYVAIFATFILLWITSSLNSELEYRANLFRVRKETKKLNIMLKDAPSTDAEKKNLDALTQKMGELETAKRSDRKQLLKDFISLKKQLESMGRDVAFLSIDVVDSTGMKENEDTYVVTHDFLEYRQFVESRINAMGVIKSAWTPDGLMACFTKLEDAVQAAQVILNDLPDFNKNVKNMKRDFALRCGINSGYIFFDDTLPLEQISDRVIDIAGHMQKNAEPNTIYVAKQIIKPVEVMKGFSDTDVHVDGLSAYKWNDTDIKKNN